MAPVVRGSGIVQFLQSPSDLHGDDAATVAPRTTRVRDRLYLLGVAASDLGGELPAQGLPSRQVANIREVLRPSGDRADHHPQPVSIPGRRDGDAGPILARTRTELPVHGASFAAWYPDLRDELVLFEGGLI